MAGGFNEGGLAEAGDGISGAEVRSFMPYGGFSGGIRVATGDVNGDGRADIIVATGPGGISGPNRSTS